MLMQFITVTGRTSRLDDLGTAAETCIRHRHRDLSDQITHIAIVAGVAYGCYVDSVLALMK